MQNKIGVVEELTVAWLEKIVVGLNLCPFAGKPYEDGRIRIVTELSDDYDQILARFLAELSLLNDDIQCKVETTLLVVPNALTDFSDYLDCLDNLNTILEHQGFAGVFQLASFHPAYQFAGTKKEDVSNFTNRAPFPVFHLIRESSMEAALKYHSDPDGIPERNISLMESMSEEKLRELFPWLFR